MYKKEKLCTYEAYEVIIKQTPFFFTDENGNRHFDSDDEVVQVLVRCKDCKYWGEVDIVDGVRYGECGNPDRVVRETVFLNENFFCADGEE